MTAMSHAHRAGPMSQPPMACKDAQGMGRVPMTMRSSARAQRTRLDSALQRSTA